MKTIKLPAPIGSKVYIAPVGVIHEYDITGYYIDAEEEEMKKCPCCGRYMTSHIEKTWDGFRLIWECPCGYVTGAENIKYSVNTKTTSQMKEEK